MRRGLLLLPVLALLLLPTGCGSEETALALDPVASAATLASDAGSARTAFAMTMKAEGRTMKLGGQGAFDFDDARGTITMDASSLLPSGSGDGRLELRMLGSMLYLRLPAGLRGLGLPGGGGKPWIGIDVEKTLQAAGLGGIDPTSLQQDPTQLLRLLRASSTSVNKAGTARIRGVATTRYTAKLDLRKSIEATGGELGLSEKERAQLRRAAEQMSTQAGLKTIPVEVFVDREGLLRRMRTTMQSTLAAAPFALTQTTDFYDFGVEVDVEAPPESQVTDLSQFTGP